VSAEADTAWRITAEGLSLRIKATPKASRNAIKGVIDLPGGPALGLAVAAPPVDGEANAELAAFISKTLGVTKGAVSIEAGGAARVKRILVRGNGVELARRLTALLA
jgi:uncharacterized protein (TIGR00251 family)